MLSKEFRKRPPNSAHQQVILSVFLDRATETLFKRLGLPIHSKEALSACEYYSTVVEGLQHKKPAQRSSTNKDLSQSITTPAQLARVAAGVNPLCTVSPKACLMVDSLMHETFMVLCEGILRRSVKTRCSLNSRIGIWCSTGRCPRTL